MALTNRQVRNVRHLCNTLPVTMNIGKENVTDAVCTQAANDLEARELIKCNVLKSCELDTRDAAYELAGRIGADVVQVIGHKFSLYRRSSRKDFEHIDVDA